MSTYGGWLQSTREYLGMTGDDMADYLGVDPRTVRAWEAGRSSAPDGVFVEVSTLIDHTDHAVADLAEDLASIPAVRVWRDTADFHRHDPIRRTWGLPARWWRHVAVRAVAQVPGAVIVSRPALVLSLTDDVGDAPSLTLVATLDSLLDTEAVERWIEHGWDGRYQREAAELGAALAADARAVLATVEQPSGLDEPGRGDFGLENRAFLGIGLDVTKI